VFKGTGDPQFVAAGFEMVSLIKINQPYNEKGRWGRGNSPTCLQEPPLDSSFAILLMYLYVIAMQLSICDVVGNSITPATMTRKQTTALSSTWFGLDNLDVLFFSFEVDFPMRTIALWLIC
jgi:hypothetical protein